MRRNRVKGAVIKLASDEDSHRADPGVVHLTFMTKRILFLTLSLCFCTGSAFSQASKSSDAIGLCKRVSEIKELPMKGDRGVDPAYEAIVGGGETVVPCLIKEITDTTPMRDPRCPSISNRTTVGDVAYFVLADLTKINFMALLPADVQSRYKTQGARVYHEYIRRKGARRQLQSKVREWYRRNKTTA
jgi:hypothetical protein